MSVSIPDDRPADAVLGFDFKQFVRDAQDSRLGVGFAIIGCFHLLVFSFCEYLFLRGDRAAVHFLPLWFLDVVFAFLVFRHRVPSISSLESSQSIRIALRVWLTFAILCLTSASLNSITGFQIDWFKICWSMMATFGFATMAWIFHLAFLIPAVQMSFTALLIAAHPDHAYAIFGVSWFFVLNSLGLVLEGNRWKQQSPRGWGRLVMVMTRRDSADV